METSCRVIADASALARTLEQQANSDGSLFYSLHFDVVLLFGLTELKAELRWNHQVFYISLPDNRTITDHPNNRVLNTGAPLA